MKKLLTLCLLSITLCAFTSRARAQQKMSLCEGVNMILPFCTPQKFHLLTNDMGKAIDGYDSGHHSETDTTRTFMLSYVADVDGAAKFKAEWKKLSVCLNQKPEILHEGDEMMAFSKFNYKGAEVTLSAIYPFVILSFEIKK